MTLSPELSRFLADHVTVESWAAFTKGVATPPTAATLAAAMNAKGYQVGETEVVAALEFGKQSALADQQLDGVGGGQAFDFVKITSDQVAKVGNELDGLNASNQDVSSAGMFKLQTQMQVMSQYIEATSNTLSAVHSAMVGMAKNVKG